MTDRSDADALIHEIDVTFERLHGSASLDLPPDARRDIAEKASGIVQSLWQRLGEEYRRRLIDERDANTVQKDQDSARRAQREHELFVGALTQSLPAAHTLRRAQELADHIRRSTGRVTGMTSVPDTKAVDGGLQALVVGNFVRALQLWADAGPVETVVQEILAQRQRLAAELIEHANLACDVIAELDSQQLRREASDTTSRKALEPVERIGTEKQREQAQWVADELASILAQPPRQVAAKPPSALPSRKLPPPIRRFVMATLLLAVVTTITWFVFARPHSGSIVEIPPTAPPQAEARPEFADGVVAESDTPEPTTRSVETATEATAGPATTPAMSATVGTRTPTLNATQRGRRTAATATPTLNATQRGRQTAAAAARRAEPTITPATATVVGPTTALPDAPSTAGRIAFTSNRTGNDDIFIMPAAGGDATNVTQHPARDFAADWSPDGSQLVFISDRAGVEQLYIVNTDGTGLRQLTTVDGRKATPAWSPDGTNIAFELEGEIYLARVQSGTLIRLTNNSIADAAPRWSSDSQQIFYSSFRTGEFAIYFTDPVGSSFVRVTVDPAAETSPAITPDNRTLAFISNRSGTQRIFVIDANGTRELPIEPALPNINRIDWSPDGAALVFSATDGQRSRIYVSGQEGAAMRQLTPDDSNDSDPAWGP